MLVGVAEPEHALTWLTKWLTVPSLPILLALLGLRVAERPTRWRVVAGAWVGLGLASVLAAALALSTFGDAIDLHACPRLWPGGEQPEAARTVLSDVGWEARGWSRSGVLVREMTATVAVALIAAVALRRCVDAGRAWVAGAAVPVVVIGGLVAYQLLVPWSLVLDYDLFVGDALLGGATGELLFFPAPFDPLASIAIGAAALAMGALILVWGRADRSAVETSRADHERLRSGH